MATETPTLYSDEYWAAQVEESKRLSALDVTINFTVQVQPEDVELVMTMFRAIRTGLDRGDSYSDFRHIARGWWGPNIIEDPREVALIEAINEHVEGREAHDYLEPDVIQNRAMRTAALAVVEHVMGNPS